MFSETETVATECERRWRQKIRWPNRPPWKALHLSLDLSYFESCTCSQPVVHTPLSKACLPEISQHSRVTHSKHFWMHEIGPVQLTGKRQHFFLQKTNKKHFILLRPINQAPAEIYKLTDHTNHSMIKSQCVGIQKCSAVKCIYKIPEIDLNWG